MDQNAKKIGLINWMVLLAVTIGMLLIAQFVDSAAAMVSAIFAGCGFLVAILSYFQLRLGEREHLEKLEFDELNKSRGSESLFASGADDTLPAKRSREQFEKYFVPIFTALLFLVQGAGAYWLWKLLGKMQPISERSMLAMSLLGLFALVLFLLGKYSAGVARLERQRLLRPGAGYLLLSAYLCFIATASIAAGQAGFSKVDFLVGRALCVVLVLIAVETIGGMVLDIYRVRIKGRETRLLYESRLVGLIGQPEGIVATVAHTLDYQFGFKISETSFYRFLQKWTPVLLVAQLGVLLLSTCFVFIEPGEQALLERFGAPVAGREMIGSGLHLKLPWPIDQVHRYRSEQIQSFIVGSEPDEEGHEGKTVVWSIAHSKEDNLLVANRQPPDLFATNDVSGKKSPPVNLLSVGIPVQFQITNLFLWAYINEDPDELLRKISTREVVRYLAGVDIDEVMSRERAAAALTLRDRIQAVADQRQLGAKIIFVGVEDIHPPVKVAADYEKVIGAKQQSEARILEARANAIKTNALARGEAFKRVQEASSERVRLMASGFGRGALFTNQMQAFQIAPGVYAQRAYLQTLARASRDVRKYVIATTNTTDVIQYNLEDKLRPDLLDVPIPPPKK